MNIIVFLKQVADTEARIIIRGDKKSLEIENKYDMNFFDKFAVEEAVRIKERLKSGQITACTLGGKKDVEALRTAVAMGADRAFLLDNTHLEGVDPLITAKILAGFAGKEGFDLILCGRQAIDDESANVGAMVAELLGIPHVSAVLKLEIVDDKKLCVESEVEGGKVTAEVDLPALVTAQKGLNEPRVPAIMGVMKAMKAVIPAVDPISLGIAKEEIVADASKITILSYEQPQQRPPVRIVEGETTVEKVHGLIKALREEAKAI